MGIWHWSLSSGSDSSSSDSQSREPGEGAWKPEDAHGSQHLGGVVWHSADVTEGADLWEEPGGVALGEGRSALRKGRRLREQSIVGRGGVEERKGLLDRLKVFWVEGGPGALLCHAAAVTL